jgi:O-antigen/teichoic acid export membrane protein
LISIDTLKHYSKNFSWMMLENLVKIFIGFAVTIYVIRYLGPSDFGLLSYALSIVGILYPVATLGLDAILFRNIIKDKENEKTLIKTGYITRIVAGVSLFLLTSILVYFYSDDKVFVWMLVILAFGMIIDAFSIYKEYFAAHVQNKYIAISSIFSNVLSSLLKLLFIFTKFSVVWFALAFIVQKLFNVIGLKYFYTKTSKKNIGTYDKKLAKQMLNDSWPLIFTSFAGLLYMYTDQILIEYYLDVKQVGLYAAAAKLVMFFYVIPSIISNIIYPKIMELHKSSEQMQFLSRIEKIYFVNFLISLAILSFFLLFGEWLILFLFDEAFKDSINVLLIYAFGLIFVFFAANNNKLLMIDNLQKLMLGRNIFGLGVNVVLNIILIPIYGIKGAAIATVLTELMIVLSYGLNGKTRYILWLQLKTFVYPIVLIKRRIV